MSPDPRIGRWRVGMTQAAGFAQHWREWQPHTQHSLPVLALHGSLTQSGMWIELAERLRDVRMLCHDQRGFGLSESIPGDSCADFTRDAKAIADTLLPGRFVVMGHSFACSMALELANRSTRVAAVVLVDPVVRLPGATPARPPDLVVARFESLAVAAQYFEATEEGVWTQDALRRFTADVVLKADEGWRLPYAKERLVRLRSFTASAESDYDLFSKARKVAQPVLVFRGGVSKRFAAAAEPALMQAFTNAASARCIVCPKSGHFPSSTEPEAMAAALAPFLERLPS